MELFFKTTIAVLHYCMYYQNGLYCIVLYLLPDLISTVIMYQKGKLIICALIIGYVGHDHLHCDNHGVCPRNQN